MVAGLSGIEMIVKTINPETLLFDTYSCVGYWNTGRFVPNSDPTKPDRLIPGKLVDWYKPMSGKGQCHSLEFLYLLHKKEGRPYETLVRGQDGYDEQTPK